MKCLMLLVNCLLISTLSQAQRDDEAGRRSDWSRGAVVQSGVSLESWARAFPHYVFTNGKIYLNQMHCTTTSRGIAMLSVSTEDPWCTEVNERDLRQTCNDLGRRFGRRGVTTVERTVCYLPRE
jgi:hypothetical protein